MDQAMDQLKEFLRQCIKYRFWISVGMAALFSTIAYFMGAGPVQAKADKETATIKQAADGVKPFTQSGIPNAQYKPIVDEKTQILTRDVNTAWKQLYNRQAPLLTWPNGVERFKEWGRKWPDNVAPSAVELAKVDYIQAYPDYVEQVYRTFNPFNYETGTGVVAAPPKEVLLKQSGFELTKLPELGQIWAGQERLWIQRTVLEVIAAVNRKAKDWDSAIIKQINTLEVGNAMAQDQRSIAKGDTLEESESIKAPGSEEADDSAAGGGGGGGGAAGGGMAQAMMGYMSRMGRGGGGSGGPTLTTAPDTISYVKPENGKDQYKILPVMLSVLIDQDHVQDLLTEMENSPMAIQVMEFELQRPATRVVKPEKGVSGSFASYGDSMMGGMMRGRGGAMAGYGGMMSNYAAMMRSMEKRGGDASGAMSSMMMGRMGMGGMGATAPARKGTDKRSTNRGEQRKEETKAVATAKGPSLFDPYYDIVEVKVYGQARFYNPPDKDAETEPSPGEVATQAAEAADAKTAAPAGAGPAAKAEAEKAQPTKAEPAKAEASKPETPKTETPKAETPKAGPASTETPPAGAAKAETPKAEPAKGDPAKPQPAPQPAKDQAGPGAAPKG